VLQT